MISVITWDAGFRESYHTVDYFKHQTLGKDKFEFIWADYYSTIKPELEVKIQAMDNGRTFLLNGKGKWHLGRCINAAVKESKGDLLVIPDGDIVVEENLLAETIRLHEIYENLVLYFRRWDEPNPEEKSKETLSISRLRDTCRLTNPTNYGGCLTIPRKVFNYVFGYEEHELFSEAGANGMELYTRLKNAGFPIMWHPEHKIYHPWHKGSYPNDPEYKTKVDKQNWVIRQRDLGIIFESDTSDVDRLILEYQKTIQKSEIKIKGKTSIFYKINKFFSTKYKQLK